MSRWFRNKKTGVSWEVGDELAKRLSKDPDYEPAEKTKTPRTPPHTEEPTDSAIKAMTKNLSVNSL